MNICCEGADGVGKGTLINNLQDHFSLKGHQSVVIRHPGGTLLGQDIRKIVKHSPHKVGSLTEALLFAADYAESASSILIPKLAAGHVCLNDRDSRISSMVYQVASGCSLDELDLVHSIIAKPSIDLLLILRADLDVMINRLAIRSNTKVCHDRFEDRGDSYTNRVRQAYASLLETQVIRLAKFVKPSPVPSGSVYGHLAVAYIDANTKPADVFGQALQLINQFIPALSDVLRV